MRSTPDRETLEIGSCGLPSTNSLAGLVLVGKIKGKKRDVLVDIQGLLLHAIVHATDNQDRDGEVLLVSTLFGLHPCLTKLYADAGYQGPRFQSGLRRVMRQVNVEIVKRSNVVKGLTVLSKRWIVERTTAWLNRCRRLAKDWECLNRKALAFLRLASARLMLRKLCQQIKSSRKGSNIMLPWLSLDDALVQPTRTPSDTP